MLNQIFAAFLVNSSCQILLVMIIIVFLKFTFLPLLSLKIHSSRICNNKL